MNEFAPRPYMPTAQMDRWDPSPAKGKSLVFKEDRNLGFTEKLPNLIALWAPAPHSGKSTVGTVLQEKFGYSYTAFAEPFKEMLITLLLKVGYTYEEAYRLMYVDKTVPIERLPGKPTGRKLQTTIGTEWARDHIHDEFWTLIWEQNAKERVSPEDRILVDDLRHKDEYRAIRSIPGAEVWAVIRPGFEDTSGHRSEQGLGDNATFERVIINDSDIITLQKKVFGVFSKESYD